MASKIHALLDRLWAMNEKDGIEQSIEKNAATYGDITTLDPSFHQPLSPMLSERFSYGGEWKNAALGQTWLNLTQIKSALSDQRVVERINLRKENWPRVPPESTNSCNTAIFGCDFEEYEETYLVWVEGQIEPQVWRYFGAEANKFVDFQRFLEFQVGDRLEDDSDPSMYSPEG